MQPRQQAYSSPTATILGLMASATDTHTLQTHPPVQVFGELPVERRVYPPVVVLTCPRTLTPQVPSWGWGQDLRVGGTTRMDDQQAAFPAISPACLGVGTRRREGETRKQTHMVKHDLLTWIRCMPCKVMVWQQHVSAQEAIVSTVSRAVPSYF
jgi:hypothetical protein